MSGLDRLFLLLYPDHRCFVCGREAPLNELGLCYDCRDAVVPLNREEQPKPAKLDGLFCACRYQEPLTAPLYALKYGDHPENARFLANLLPPPPHTAADLLLAVPGRRERPYNHSYLIADCWRKRGNAPPLAEKLLVRRIDTPRQASLSAAERARYIHQAFACNGDLDGKRVLLIDDVCTSGNTLSACATALKAAGASRVYGLTVFCAPIGADQADVPR